MQVLSKIVGSGVGGRSISIYHTDLVHGKKTLV